MPWKAALVASLSFVVFMMFYAASCPKAPPEFEPTKDAGQENGVSDAECTLEVLWQCEADLQDARSDAELWKEMAENCVAQKVGVRAK